MKKYCIFDSRANENIDNATCFDVFDTEKKARENVGDYGDDCVIVSYDIENKNELINETILL